MDSRNIKEPTPQIEDGKHLEKIYDLQKELLDSYIKIEGLPSYPIDVNSKKSQIILKDFTGRVIEELGEGYESMLKVFNKIRCNILKPSLKRPLSYRNFPLANSRV